MFRIYRGEYITNKSDESNDSELFSINISIPKGHGGTVLQSLGYWVHM